MKEPTWGSSIFWPLAVLVRMNVISFIRFKYTRSQRVNTDDCWLSYCIYWYNDPFILAQIVIKLPLKH